MGRKALAGVGSFAVGVVWLGVCILGRFGESEGLGRAGVEGWWRVIMLVIVLGYMVWVYFKGGHIFIHSPELFPGLICLLPDDL